MSTIPQPKEFVNENIFLEIFKGKEHIKCFQFVGRQQNLDFYLKCVFDFPINWLLCFCFVLIIIHLQVS